MSEDRLDIVPQPQVIVRQLVSSIVHRVGATALDTASAAMAITTKGMTMTTNTSSNTTSSNTTSTTGSNAGSRRSTRTFVAGGIVAGCLAVGIGVAAAQQSAVRSESVDQTTVAQWARDRHLSGLSPSSLTGSATTPASTAIDQSTIADWARRNNLTGFSPSSLGVGSD